MLAILEKARPFWNSSKYFALYRHESEDGVGFMRRNFPVAVSYYHQSNQRLYNDAIASEIVSLAIVLGVLGMAAMFYLIWPSV
jgi:hypothetical protein